MKKIALTSLLAVAVAGAAHAANTMDGNPLYKPTKGHFYSETALFTNTDHGKDWTLAEDFGYGITDQLSINVVTDMSEIDSFDGAEWGTLGFGLNYRFLDMGPWKADLYGAYGLDPVWGDHASFLDKDQTWYAWTVGMRAGFQTSLWTVAGHFDFSYVGDESFNWGDDGRHIIRVGVDGQYVFTRNWNVVAGIEYTGFTDSWADNAGEWTCTFGINYNIDATKYVGAYVTASMDHLKDNGEKGWELNNGVELGVKFGIDF